MAFLYKVGKVREGGMKGGGGVRNYACSKHEHDPVSRRIIFGLMPKNKVYGQKYYRLAFVSRMRK